MSNLFLKLKDKVSIVKNVSNQKVKVPVKYQNRVGYVHQIIGKCYKVEIIFNRKKFYPIFSRDHLRIVV